MIIDLDIIWITFFIKSCSKMYKGAQLNVFPTKKCLQINMLV